MKSAAQWIEKLGLTPLPEEGGMYKEVYRSTDVIPRSALPDSFSGERSYCTSIYYLLEHPEFSAFHRLNQEEIWHYYEGSPLTVHIIDPDGSYSKVRMGRDIDAGEMLQLVLYAGQLFAAEAEPDSYALIGCTVAPGFEFDDFEAPSRQWLLESYPQYCDLILQYTR